MCMESGTCILMGAKFQMPLTPAATSLRDATPVRRDAAAAIPFQLQVAAGYAWRVIVIAIALAGCLMVTFEWSDWRGIGKEY